MPGSWSSICAPAPSSRAPTLRHASSPDGLAAGQKTAENGVVEPRKRLPVLERPARTDQRPHAETAGGGAVALDAVADQHGCLRVDTGRLHQHGEAFRVGLEQSNRRVAGADN